jgi:carbon monoxide dehydrogenase subunit G
MAQYVTTIRTARPADQAFSYLADLRNFADWDPGVTRAEQVTGDGPGPDAAFDLEVRAAGRPQMLRYQTVTYHPPREIIVRARTGLFTSLDRIMVGSEQGATIVTYDAKLKLNGVLSVGDALLRRTFRRIGEAAAAGLRDALDGTFVDPH